MITKAFTRTALRAYIALESVVDVTNVFNGLKVEFTHTREGELQQYGALGLAWLNRNLNFMPANTSRSDLQLYSGIYDMELKHSMTYRLTNDAYMFNDIEHWLFNEGHLITDNYGSWTNLIKYGGALKLVQSDLRYGWDHRNEIMAGIRDGTYKEKQNLYWADPANAGKTANFIPATEHELSHLRDFIEHGHHHH